MANLQRYTSFEKLKSAPDSEERVPVRNAVKFSELEDFIISLRNNLSLQKKAKTVHEKHVSR